ncbi:MAG: recJ [Candidatus Parcubacteria bacterium]|nr:recJ [Candidatus Parcubacteria bacterium]
MPAYATRKPLTVDEKNNLSSHSDLLAHLLFHRGITDSEAAGRFLAPEYDRDTHDPFLLKDADKAAARIIQAVQSGEKIAVYADYDADGIPGAALFNDLFSRIGYTNFVVYIPHRHNEGFGLHEGAIDELAASGVKLLITVDCGISDRAAAEHAREKGIEVIITDHHEPPGELPHAVAVIDPKQPGCVYPDKNLCGTGVAFKLIQAILAKNRFGLKDGMEKWLLDLVGIATLSDMVPLTGENRVFAHYGMTVLRKTQRLGLKRLFTKLKIAQAHLTEDDITFMITPRINAASRMGVPMDAFRLLAAQDEATAKECADHLDEINNERKGVVAALVKDVKKKVRERHAGIIPSVIVLGNPEWRPSLLGLAANSCAEEFRRPVFLWGRDGENALKGSCRSEGTTNVVELMRAVPAGVFMEFGGHKHSGGFSVESEAVHFLEKHLNDAAGVASAESANSAPDMVDAELSLDAITSRLHDDIARLAPFGLGNPKPLFVFRNVKPVSVRRFGKGNDHVELTFAKGNGYKVSAISFFGVTEEWAATTEAGMNIDLIASVEKSMFRGRPELRLRVVDVVRA